MSYTTDPKDPRLGKGIDEKEIPQHEVYLILSDEERAKGFIRPVRKSYVHVGRKLNYAGIDKMISPDDPYAKYNDKVYVATMIVNDQDGKKIGSSYVTQEELDAWKDGKYIGGCGTLTTMAQPLAETYATNTSFYGATYCCGCKKHLYVGEFLWDGTNETVGS